MYGAQNITHTHTHTHTCTHTQHVHSTRCANCSHKLNPPSPPAPIPPHPPKKKKDKKKKKNNSKQQQQKNTFRFSMACEVTLTLNRIVSSVIHQRPFPPRWNFAHEKKWWVFLGEHFLHWFLHLPNCKLHTCYIFVWIYGKCMFRRKKFWCAQSLFQTKGFVLLLYSIQLQHFIDYDTLWGGGGGGGELVFQRKRNFTSINYGHFFKLIFCN